MTYNILIQQRLSDQYVAQNRVFYIRVSHDFLGTVN